MDGPDYMDIDNDWSSDDSGDTDDNGSVASINHTMSDSNGDVQLRTYRALDPPTLPSHAIWSEHSWCFTAKKTAQNGFDVRQMNIDQWGETEVDAQGQWSAEYMLGPPSLAPDWHPLIEKYGLQVLKAAGFINYNSKDPDDYAPPKGQAAEERNPGTREEQRIHPVFRKEMWKDLDHDDYTLLEPALLIASAYLDDIATLNFFHTVGAIDDEIGTFNDADLGLCKVATIPATLTEYEQILAYEKVESMCDWTTWRFESVEEMLKRGCTGLTSVRFEKLAQDRDEQEGEEKKPRGRRGRIPTEEKEGEEEDEEEEEEEEEKDDEKKGLPLLTEREFTYQTEITISEAFLEILQQFDDDVSNGTDIHLTDLLFGLRSGYVPENRRIKIDVSSAIDRTNFLLATVLLHEFAHAFIKAWHQVPSDDLPTEPWIDGNRCNESGHAFTNYIMGACPEGISAFLPPMAEAEDHRQTVSAPFGIFFAAPWDQWALNAAPNGPQRVMKEGTSQSLNAPLTIYPVLQKFVHNLSTKETWEEQVPRYGLRALRVPMLDRWAVQLLPGNRLKGLWCTGQERWGDLTNDPSPATWA